MKFEGIRRILVPVDFSKTSSRAYEYAKGLAPCSGAEVHVVHVLDTHSLSGALHVTIVSRDEMVKEWKKRSTERFHSTYGKDETGTHPVQLHLREGRPHEEILKASEDLAADIIIIGSHGRSGLERSIFGSVAERVMKMAEVPVLLIKLKGRSGVIPE